MIFKLRNNMIGIHIIVYLPLVRFLLKKTHCSLIGGMHTYTFIFFQENQWHVKLLTHRNMFFMQKIRYDR